MFFIHKKWGILSEENLFIWCYLITDQIKQWDCLRGNDVCGMLICCVWYLIEWLTEGKWSRFIFYAFVLLISLAFISDLDMGWMFGVDRYSETHMNYSAAGYSDFAVMSFTP